MLLRPAHTFGRGTDEPGLGATDFTNGVLHAEVDLTDSGLPDTGRRTQLLPTLLGDPAITRGLTFTFPRLLGLVLVLIGGKCEGSAGM